MNDVGPLDFFRTWVLEDPATRAPLTLIALGVLLVLPLAGFAAYLWRMSARAIAERAFPPSGYKVAGKTRPVTGDDALRSARATRWIAIILILAALVLVFQLWRFTVLLASRIGS